MSEPSAPDLESMTKAQLQSYADENGVEGVNSSRQTKAEMISVISEAMGL